MDGATVEQAVSRMLDRIREPSYALTANGGIRQRRLLDTLRASDTAAQDEEFKVPDETWD